MKIGFLLKIVKNYRASLAFSIKPLLASIIADDNRYETNQISHILVHACSYLYFNILGKHAHYTTDDARNSRDPNYGHDCSRRRYVI